MAQTIEFQLDLDGHNERQGSFGSGWSAPEDGKRWMLDALSELRIPPPRRNDHCFLVVDILPFLAPPAVQSQRLEIWFNNVRVGSLEVTTRGRFAFPIPLAAFGTEHISIGRFVHPNFARPSDRGISGDSRPLSFRLDSLRIVRDEEMSTRYNREATQALGKTFSSKADVAGIEARLGVPAPKLLTGFCSVGNSCEFGLVQRRTGAEPMDLLRFASTFLPNLIAGIDDSYARLGEDDEISADLAPATGELRREYVISEKPYEILYHPFVFEGDIDAVQLEARERRRLKFLRDKFLDDLQAGERVFVIKKDAAHEAEMTALAIAVRAHGRGWVLWVDVTGEPGKWGRVEVVHHGLMKGSIERFAPVESAKDMSYETWLAICANARMIKTNLSRLVIDEAGELAASPIVVATPDMHHGTSTVKEGGAFGKMPGDYDPSLLRHCSSDPPQRYTVNYWKYLALGGVGRPPEFLSRALTADPTSNRDMARFYFFCLVFDHIVKEDLQGDFAEVGVYKGGTAALLATFVRQLNRELHLFDTFEGFDRADLTGIDAGTAEHFKDTSEESVRSIVGLERVRFFKGRFPETASAVSTDTRFCLVHLDCDLYAPTRDALRFFYPRLVPGGFMIVHDYSSLAWGGPERAVDEFLADKIESVVPLTDNAGSIVFRKARSLGEETYWMWRKGLALSREEWTNAGANALVPLLESGWSGPEDWGVWGVGHTHVLRLFVADPVQGDYQFHADCHAARAGTRDRQDIQVSIGETTVATWTFTRDQNRAERTVRLPGTAAVPIAPGISVFRLEFRPSFTDPPSLLDPSNGDDRHLGLALHRLRLCRWPKIVA